jgi:hypothetical protein
MIKSVRLALLLALTALASWISVPKAAHALPTCNNLDGFECLKPNSHIQCTWVGQSGAGFCTCNASDMEWHCF